MAVLLVMYDLNREGKSSRDYKAFYKVIKSYDWVRLSDSTYAIKTEARPDQVWSRLKPNTDPDDDVLVVTLSFPLAGVHRADTIRWIQSNVPWR